MIDESLAKGLTRRFLEEYHAQSIRKIERFRPEPKALCSRAAWLKFVKNFQSAGNTWAVHAGVYGSNRKPNIGFMTLVRTEHNALKDWDESMLRFMRWDFSFHHGAGLDRDIPLALSHHVIQRVFQRSKFSRDTCFKDVFKFFKQEFSYIPFWYGIYFALCVPYKCQRSEIRNGSISVPIPSKDGLFLCDFTFPDDRKLPKCDIRTFVGTHQFSEDQDQIFQVMKDVVEGFSTLPFMYLMGSPFQTIREDETGAIGAEGIESVFMLEAMITKRFEAFAKIIDFIVGANSSNSQNASFLEENLLAFRSIATDGNHLANILSKSDPALWSRGIQQYWRTKRLNSKKASNH